VRKGGTHPPFFFFFLPLLPFPPSVMSDTLITSSQAPKTPRKRAPSAPSSGRSEDEMGGLNSGLMMEMLSNPTAAFSRT